MYLFILHFYLFVYVEGGEWACAKVDCGHLQGQLVDGNWFFSFHNVSSGYRTQLVRLGKQAPLPAKPYC